MNRMGVSFSLVVLLAVFGSFCNTALGHQEGDGFLRLYQSHLDEFLEIHYRDDKGALDQNALKRINRFMRSRDSGLSGSFSTDLIFLLDQIQDHFDVDTVEIISGYRSPAFNAYLRRTGHRVARESFHLKGMAVDIHLDEITEEALQHYVRRIHAGGVGYYPNHLMVHIDTGPQRFWEEKKVGPQLDIGEVNKTLDLRMTSDRLVYRKGDVLKLRFSRVDPHFFEGRIHLERFFRGKWKETGEFDLPDPGSQYLEWRLSSSLSHGKFRWKLSARDGRVQYSNEFYLKRK